MPKNQNKKLIVVLGPTSSGKSELAVMLAKKFNGEIISADSRQVYRGLDIGSGKVPKDSGSESKTEGIYMHQGIVHHLLDVAPPKNKFTVAEYKDLALRALSRISQKGKLPIIAGGTGMYIDAVLYERPLPEVPPNEEFRKELQKKPKENLFAILEKKDPERAKDIDKNNKRRLIRALEIIDATGDKVPKTPRNQWLHSKLLSKIGIRKKDILIFGIKTPIEKLEKRIEKRLKDRLKDGMLKEAQELHKKGLSWRRMDELGLEYRFMSRYLSGKISKEEMQQKITTESRRYAKRQMTWWKRNPEIKWIGSEAEAVSLAKDFLKI